MLVYRFYKKMGFHEIGRADDDVWMLVANGSKLRWIGIDEEDSDQDL